MKGSDGYVRDSFNNGAVLNTDNTALKAYKQQKAKFNEMNQMKEDLKDVKNLKNEVKEIKETKSKGTPTVEETVEVVYDLFLEKFSHLANNDKNKKIIHELCEISVNNMPDKVSNPTYYLNFIESSIKSIKQSNQNLENF